MARSYWCSASASSSAGPIPNSSPRRLQMQATLAVHMEELAPIDKGFSRPVPVLGLTGIINAEFFQELNRLIVRLTRILKSASDPSDPAYHPIDLGSFQSDARIGLELFTQLFIELQDMLGQPFA
jgi:hypothetical protein